MTLFKPQLTVSIGALAASVLMVACAVATKDAGPVSDVPRETTRSGVDLMAHDGAFEPLVLRLRSGGRAVVLVRNDGNWPHTVTVPRLGIDESIAAGTTERIGFHMPSRVVRFHCRFHPKMSGRLVPSPAN